MADTAKPITGETWGDEIEPVRVYLSQEADQPFASLRPKLDAAHQALLAATEGVSDTQGQFRPGTGEGEDAWGIAEALRHVASIEPIMADRVRALGTGQKADALPATYPGYLEAVETRQVAELRPILEQSYADLVAAIEAVAGNENLDTLDEHRRFGPLNCRGWVAMHTLHLQDHARQVGKIKALPGYPSA
jgi:hypothetical protein